MYDKEFEQRGIILPKAYRGGDVKVRCPKCSDQRTYGKHEPCLSANPQTGVWNCHHCGWAGNLKKEHKGSDRQPLYNEIRRGYSGARVYTNQQEMEEATRRQVPLSDNAINWLGARGIRGRTNPLVQTSFRSSMAFIPAVQEDRSVIAFNYINEHNEVVGIKYRDGAKNFSWERGSAQIPFGSQLAFGAEGYSDSDVPARPGGYTFCLICEGEIDCATWWELLFRTISAPSAPPVPKDKPYSPRLEWLDGYWEKLDQFDRIYLAPDNDPPGIALMEEIARRIGKEKCWFIKYPEGCKDANDVLKNYGEDALRHCFETAEPPPIEGISDAETEHDAIEELLTNGYPVGVELGYVELGRVFRVNRGEVTLVTGIPGHGKTSFVKQVLVRLSENGGLRHLIYSGEEASPAMALSDIYAIRSGLSFLTEVSGHTRRITGAEISQLRPWVAEHFKYIKLDDGALSVDTVLAKARELVMRIGIDTLVIDNMSTIEGVLPRSGETRHHAIGDMMTKISQAAKRLGLHIFLIAHPKKMDKINGRYRVPTGYDVGDSSHYYNKPDNGITVYRNIDANTTDIHIWKVRFRYSGETGSASFLFNRSNGRYAEVSDGSGGQTFRGQPTGFGDV